MPKANRCRTILAVCLPLLFRFSGAFCEEQVSLPPGARVRATLVAPEFGSVVDPKVITGTVLDLSETSLTVESSTKAPPIVIPLRNIANLELNLRQGRRKKGALIGLAAGAATGVLVALALDATHDDDPDSWDLVGTKALVGFSAFYFGSVGSIVGALVAPGARWQSIPADQIRLGLGNGGQAEGRLCFAVRF